MLGIDKKVTFDSLILLRRISANKQKGIDYGKEDESKRIRV